MGDQIVLEVKGKKGGNYYSTGNGFYYRIKEKRSSSCWKLKCKNRKCGGTATLFNPEGDKKILEKAPHSCDPDIYFHETNKLREDIINRCKTELTPSSEIFREECTKR